MNKRKQPTPSPTLNLIFLAFIIFMAARIAIA